MRATKFYLCATACLLLAVALQVAFGNVPFEKLAFPLNVLLAALWIATLWMGYKEARHHAVVRALLSPRCSVFALAAFVAGCLVVGLFPQLPPNELAARNGLLARFGFYNFTTSWPFVAVLFLLMTNLGFIIVRACSEKKKVHRVRFLLNHVGLWIVLFAGFFGCPDTQTLRLPANRNQPTREAFDEVGRTSTLPYEITFRTFRVEYFPNGMPSLFEAKIQLDENEAVLKVNHPYRRSFSEDVYLTGYDTMLGDNTPYCVLQIVRQPWRYVTLAGILAMFFGAVLLFFYAPNRKEVEA